MIANLDIAQQSTVILNTLQTVLTRTYIALLLQLFKTQNTEFIINFVTQKNITSAQIIFTA